MTTHYSDMAKSDLGLDATDRDLREFQLICEAAEELHPDIDDITSVVWGEGDYYNNARKLGVDLDAIEKQFNETMIATKTAYELGYEDGAAAYRESGSTAAPIDGWDSDLVNALGLPKVCELLGLNEAEERGGWSEKGLAALKQYCRGCQAGVEAEAVAE